jgi:hypothetical protein
MPALDPFSQDTLKLFEATGELRVGAEIADSLEDNVFLADRELDGRVLAELQASLDLSDSGAGGQNSRAAGGLHQLVKSGDETLAIPRTE